MKMKSIFLAALAALTLASCAKDEPAATTGNGKTNFVVTLPGAPSTYAVEDPQAAGAITPVYTDVTTYLVDGGDNVTIHEWESAEITAKQKRFEQITEPAKVIVVVNKGSADLATGVATMDQLQTVLEQLAIADQNKPGGVGTLSVQHVTLYGEQTTFTTEPSPGVGDPHDGHALKKAAVELKSLVSRFEAGTLKKGTGLVSLEVEAVYINNFYNTYSMNFATQYNDVTWSEPYTPAWATDAVNAGVTSGAGTKAYAYQVFTGNMVPHIIYKVGGELEAGYKLPDGTTGVFSGKYVTVRGFKVSGKTLIGSNGDDVDDSNVSNYEMKAHEIYKMGLENGGIEITPDQITDNPEKAKMDLIVEITVAPWTVQNVTPEI